MTGNNRFYREPEQPTSNEIANAIALAGRLLDEHGCDPDDDLRVLSRQLLRRIEEIEYWYALAKGGSTSMAEEIQRLRDALDSIASPPDNYGWWTQVARRALGYATKNEVAQPPSDQASKPLLCARLRESAKYHTVEVGDMLEAADEIERLRQRVTELEQPWSAIAKQAMKQEGIDAQTYIVRFAHEHPERMKEPDTSQADETGASR
jgi:hypothetical protein